MQGVIGERVCQAAAAEVKSCPLNYRVESNPSLASSRLPRLKKKKKKKESQTRRLSEWCGVGVGGCGWVGMGVSGGGAG